jgi:hypothetical protein
LALATILQFIGCDTATISGCPFWELGQFAKREMHAPVVVEGEVENIVLDKNDAWVFDHA